MNKTSNFIIIYKRKTLNDEQLVDFLSQEKDGEIKYGYAYTKVDENMKEIDPNIDEDAEIWDCVSMDGGFKQPFASGKELESFIGNQGIEDEFLEYKEDWKNLDSSLMKMYLGKNPESVTIINKDKFDNEWLCQFINDKILSYYLDVSYHNYVNVYNEELYIAFDNLLYVFYLLCSVFLHF